MSILKWNEHPEIQARFNELMDTGMTYREMADIMSDEFGRPFTPNQLMKRKHNMGSTIIERLADELDFKPKTTITENSNGINISGDILVDENKPITGDYLMEMFGYDKSEFEVMNSSSTVWDAPTVGSKQKMYRCKLTVKRKIVPLSSEDIAKIVTEVEPKYIVNNEQFMPDTDSILVIPVYDKHFGISSLESYSDELSEIVESIDDLGHGSVVIGLGGDLFHNDSIIHGATTRGTQIDKVDMFKAVGDFTEYISTIIETSLSVSNDVQVVSVAGNHDTTVGYLVTETIRSKYPQCTWHNAFSESQLWRRAILVNDVMLGFAHGDKSTANIDRVFSNEFPREWGLAKSRDIYIGHLHSKRELQVMTENRDGVTVRRMPSANKLDNYHIQNGFTGANARTVLTYYANGKIKGEYYI